VALLVVIGVAGALALAGLGGSKHPVAHTAQKAAPTTAKRTRAAATKPKAAAAEPAPTQSSTSTAPAPPAPPSAQQLQLTGHNEMLAGNYPEAIATLRKAVSAADPSSLTYAYGLYDLGVALLKSGNPASAVPVLEQRLKIPNQTSVVEQTLNEALRASGQAPPPAHGPGKGRGHGRGHGSGAGPSGGAGLTPPGHGGNEHPNFVD
jgi:tetratricopeptide (TPR) repeat protein